MGYSFEKEDLNVNSYYIKFENNDVIKHKGKYCESFMKTLKKEYFIIANVSGSLYYVSRILFRLIIFCLSFHSKNLIPKIIMVDICYLYLNY